MQNGSLEPRKAAQTKCIERSDRELPNPEAVLGPQRRSDRTPAILVRALGGSQPAGIKLRNSFAHIGNSATFLIRLPPPKFPALDCCFEPTRDAAPASELHLVLRVATYKPVRAASHDSSKPCACQVLHRCYNPSARSDGSRSGTLKSDRS
jgi:hypothetical protein